LTGALRPTLTDVAAEAGVSTALVSIVVREAPGASAATRRRVLEVADRLGYRPDRSARMLRSGHSRLLGVVFDVERLFHGELVAGLYAAAERIGYELALSAVTPRRDEAAAFNSLLQDRCEAMLALSLTSTTSELAGIASRMPIVVIGRSIRHARVDVVRNDDAQGVRKAIDHLVALGHRRIAHVDGGRGAVSVERRRGYLDAMRHHGLEDNARVVPGGSGEEDGIHAVARLLSEATPVPTAIAAYNDQAAIGVLNAFRTAGWSIPGDMSVVGNDDERAAGLSHIDLTTIAQDTTTMTALATARAKDRIERLPIARRELIIPPRLIVRNTTAWPRDPV
jgi:DNA-binding LacI/PurR family transcriptional regulator